MDAAAWLKANGDDRFKGPGCHALLTPAQCDDRKSWDTWGCFGCARAPEIEKRSVPWCRKCGERAAVGGHGKCGTCYRRTYRNIKLTTRRPAPEPIAEGLMASKKGICKQCGEERSLPARGLCGRCYQEHRRNMTVRRLEPAGGAGEPVTTPTESHADQAPAPPLMGPTGSGTDDLTHLEDEEPVQATPDGAPFLLLRFEVDDVPLLEALEEDARANRRSPDQHLLWILDHVLKLGTRALERHVA